jgi:predicted enzyme related to lactoylglutathione lyase
MAEHAALAALARSLARALEAFAAADQHAAAADEPLADQPPRPADEHALGKRQRQIVEVAGLATEAGLKTADIAAAVDYEVPNTYTALQALARSQVVEQVPAKDPQHWRLVRRYRAGARVFARIMALVGDGEWTTAGDVSIAARGDLRASEAIARAGLSERVLLDARQGDPRQRVGWDELARRAAHADERRRTMTTAALNYLQIPALDLEESIAFYEDVLGWRVTRHPAVGNVLEQTGYPEFVDSTGRAGGGFVLGRPAAREPGLLPCIAVDSIDEVLAAVVTHGGDVVKPRTPIVEGVDWEAQFRDPAGNVFGLFEQHAS